MQRREFIRNATLSAAALAFPTIIPARVLGAGAPSKRIHLAQIGCGRIAEAMDVPGFLRCPAARFVAVCDLDTKRLTKMKTFLEADSAKKGEGGALIAARDYRELLTRRDIDAVVISTPDHWHAQIAVEAAFTGKHVYMQKPCSLTIREGRVFSDAIRETGVKFLQGSQQRSWGHFHDACAFVREGRLGKIKSIEIGLPGDPGGGSTQEMPVPENLDYDFWLGSTPQVFYTEDRVHSQKDVASRPGWLRCEQFGAGMITGWGSHHLDIAHWAMGWEGIGPRYIEGAGKFHTGGLWNVHGDYDITLTFPDGTPMRVWNKFPNGVRFIGENGWIFVSRGAEKMTATDPVSPGRPLKALDASNPALIAGRPAVSLYDRAPRDPGLHQQNFIDAILEDRASIVPAEAAHRSCSSCLLSWIGMKLGRRLEWDWRAERFVGAPDADALLARTERAPYGAVRAYNRAKRRPFFDML